MENFHTNSFLLLFCPRISFDFTLWLSQSHLLSVRWRLVMESIEKGANCANCTRVPQRCTGSSVEHERRTVNLSVSFIIFYSFRVISGVFEIHSCGCPVLLCHRKPGPLSFSPKQNQCASLAVMGYKVHGGEKGTTKMTFQQSLAGI